jgi:hypothetical protein
LQLENQNVKYFVQDLEYNETYAEPENYLQIHIQNEILGLINSTEDACPLSHLVIRMENHKEGFNHHL